MCYTAQERARELLKNSFYIEDELLPRMIHLLLQPSQWNIYAIQITMDGYADAYRKRKRYPDQDENAYYKSGEMRIF